MGNNVEKFNHEVFGAVDVFIIEGVPHFYGKSIAELLGYSNPNKAVRDHVDAEDKVGTKRSTLGGHQDIQVVNESGLYTLIIKSKLPQAKAFKRWVTSEVLPSIRKHGGYVTGQEEMSPEELMAKAVLMADSKIKEMKGIIEEKEELISDKNFPVSISKMFSGNNRVAQAANFHMEHEGWIKKSFEKGKKIGWTLTEKGEELGYGTQSGKHQIIWVPKILDLLPSQRTLMEFAELHGIFDYKRR